jgi:hypothetical protein
MVEEQTKQKTSMEQVASRDNGPHGVISQKIEIFITTAVRTSVPTYHRNIAFISVFSHDTNRVFAE